MTLTTNNRRLLLTLTIAEVSAAWGNTTPDEWGLLGPVHAPADETVRIVGAFDDDGADLERHDGETGNWYPALDGGFPSEDLYTLLLDANADTRDCEDEAALIDAYMASWDGGFWSWAGDDERAQMERGLVQQLLYNLTYAVNKGLEANEADERVTKMTALLWLAEHTAALLADRAA